MDIIVRSEGGSRGILTCGEASFRCALGKTGITREKREGDHATPSGRFPLRWVFYRGDKQSAPETALPLQAISENDGWCDDPESPFYNRFVELPFSERHEKMWREDDVYDVVIIIGHNDAPVVPGAGSCIFLHIARQDYSPTEGCVAISKEDMVILLAELGPESTIVIEEPDEPVS